jgi:threonine synthase
MRATLGEGNTPLAPSMHSPGVSFKLECCNPSGSYKDRFIAAEVTRLLASGARACVATSSGNTGSALAAYCARYGIRAVILVNQDAPAGKLAQMQAHGAQVVRIPEFAQNPAVTAEVFSTLSAFSKEFGVPLVVSAFLYCPEGMKGVESIAGELAPYQPDHVFAPVGGGGLYSAVVQGFQALGGKMPRIHAVQPAGCPTVVGPYKRGESEVRPVTSTTRVSGLSVPTDIDAGRALAALQVANGVGIAVSDEEVFAAQRQLLEREGIYSEPAGATAFAGWDKARREGIVNEGESSICLVTGHGFKDPASVQEAANRHPDVTLRAGDLSGALRRIVEG